MKSRRIAVDWDVFRKRLAAAAVATEAALRPSPERSRAIMDERAAALARVPESTAIAALALEVLSFGLAGERYAMETRFVREVARQPDVTPLPGTPPFILGLANLRGSVLALVDLARLLEIGDARQDDCPWTIVVGRERAEFGITCDAVNEVITLRPDEVLSPSGLQFGEGRELVRGVSKQALIVLEIAALLDDPRLWIQ
jgi:purine-binding chemotaxis protein CheW